HEYAAYVLVILALGHGVMALKHHFIDKRSTLIRMIKP
ncbi:MAG TPA: cytochrome b, partial [Idiomarina baltica]|nr:cytochrome b [Idiomarina baltica]